MSLTERKFLALQRREGKKELLPRENLRGFVLQEEGKRFMGSFKATHIEGVYNFVILIEGVTPECEPFQRELTYSLAVFYEREKPRE